MDLLRTGAPEMKALDAKRAEIAALEAEIDVIIRADAADGDLLEHCRRAVQSEIEKMRVASAFGNLRRSDAFIDAMDFRGMARLHNTLMPELTWGAIFYLIGEEPAARTVFDAAKRCATTEPGLPNAERSKRIAELRDTLRQLEREEEREILALEAAGFHVLRRRDIDPQIIFDVWAAYQEPARAAA